MNYYYNLNGITSGPLPIEQLINLINPETLIWNEDGSMPNWVPANQIELIAKLINPVNKVAPPPPPVQKVVPPPVNKVAPPPPPVQKVVPPPVNKVAPPPPPVQKVVPPPVQKVAPPPPQHQINQSQPNFTPKTTSKRKYLLPLGIAALVCLGIFALTNMGNNSSSSYDDEEYTAPRSHRNVVEDEESPTEKVPDESASPSNSSSNNNESSTNEKSYEQPRSRKIICPNCNGKGTVIGNQKCWQCNHNVYCEEMDHGGYVEVMAGKCEECPVCHGIGKRETVCLTCNGDKRVNEYE